jgi:hypothetical protein
MWSNDVGENTAGCRCRTLLLLKCSELDGLSSIAGVAERQVSAAMILRLLRVGFFGRGSSGGVLPASGGTRGNAGGPDPPDRGRR